MATDGSIEDWEDRLRALLEEHNGALREEFRVPLADIERIVGLVDSHTAPMDSEMGAELANIGLCIHQLYTLRQANGTIQA